MRKTVSKIFALILVAILTLSSFSSIVYGATISSAKLSSSHKTAYFLKYKGQNSRASYVTYTKDGKQYPAYCLNDGLPGAESGAYTVDVSDMSTNSKVWRVMKNGFPYKSASSMGLKTNDQAFYVTKHAIYCVTGQRDISDYTSRSGYKYVLTALQKLVDIGLNGTETYKKPNAKINKKGDLTKETIDGKEYYVQNFNVTSTLDFTDYKVNVTKLPEGSKILNSDNKEQTSFTGSQEFKVAVPEESLTEDIKANIMVSDVEVKSYPILYGKAPSASKQNYCLASDPYEITNSSSSFNITLTKPEIIKTERGTDTKLPGAEYDVYKDTNENKVVDEGEEVVKHVGPTDENGKVEITDLPIGHYVAIETVAPEGYNLDSDHMPFEVTPTVDKATLSSTDTVITSTLEVTKVAKDDNEITGDKKGEPLAGALFNIYDINHKLLHENLKTDEEGKINITLRYGKYIVEEVRPPEYYLLGGENNEQVFEVKKQGELIPITFENESVKIGLVIEKKGIVQCQANDEILYDFPQLKNDSNVSLDNFTWKDVLPTEYIRATKLYTGTYNEDLNYTVWYKTNKSDYKQYMNDKSEDGTFNTQTNNYIDLAKLNSEDEYVTEWKVEFGTVKAGFEAVEKPFMFAKVNDTVKDNDKWTNHTYLTGNYTSIDGETIDIGSKDDWTTTSYSYSLSISKLPKTGF